MIRRPARLRPVHAKLGDLRWRRYVRERVAELKADGWLVWPTDGGTGFTAAPPPREEYVPPLATTTAPVTWQRRLIAWLKSRFLAFDRTS